MTSKRAETIEVTPFGIPRTGILDYLHFCRQNKFAELKIEMKDFSSRIQQVLDAENLTAYGASMIIGAETDEPIKTINQRINRWLKRTPKTWKEIESSLGYLGYEIIIRRRQK